MSSRSLRLAPGYRNYNTGALVNVGNNGPVWASGVSGTNARDLWFNATNLNAVSDASNRGNGFPVRCLQAFTPAYPLFLSVRFYRGPWRVLFSL